MKKYLIGILVGIIVFLSAFISHQVTKQYYVQHPVYAPADTVTITDTFFFEKPVPSYIYLKDSIPYPVTVSVHDTISDTVFVNLPREEKIYKDSTYRAVVSGVYPSLDTIEVYRNTITITEIQEKKYVPNFTVGIQVGVGTQYDLISKNIGIGPYCGIGLQYNIPVGIRKGWR